MSLLKLSATYVASILYAYLLCYMLNDEMYAVGQAHG